MVADPVNVGKAERLDKGFGNARHDLVAVTAADTHSWDLPRESLEPQARP